MGEGNLPGWSLQSDRTESVIQQRPGWKPQKSSVHHLQCNWNLLFFRWFSSVINARTLDEIAAGSSAECARSFNSFLFELYYYFNCAVSLSLSCSTLFRLRMISFPVFPFFRIFRYFWIEFLACFARDNETLTWYVVSRGSCVLKILRRLALFDSTWNSLSLLYNNIAILSWKMITRPKMSRLPVSQHIFYSVAKSFWAVGRIARLCQMHPPVKRFRYNIYAPTFSV